MQICINDCMVFVNNLIRWYCIMDIVIAINSNVNKSSQDSRWNSEPYSVSLH